MVQALLPLSEALQAGDPAAADRAGRLALSNVALDHPPATTSYFALLVSTAQGRRRSCRHLGFAIGCDAALLDLASLQNHRLPILANRCGLAAGFRAG